jgi:hypothetical protein
LQKIAHGSAAVKRLLTRAGLARATQAALFALQKEENDLIVEKNNGAGHARYRNANFRAGTPPGSLRVYRIFGNGDEIRIFELMT